jgi:hypothetical protein
MSKLGEGKVNVRYLPALKYSLLEGGPLKAHTRFRRILSLKFCEGNVARRIHGEILPPSSVELSNILISASYLDDKLLML